MKNRFLLGLLLMLLLVLIPNLSPAAHWWDKFGEPQYGGTLNVWTGQNFLTNFNPNGMGGGWLGHVEGLFMRDWAVDRSICDFKTEFVDPQYYKGALAESWDYADPQTVTVHIHQNVHWQDKAPMNGRELTADDVEYSYARVMGTSGDVSGPNPILSQAITNVIQVVAKDKYTVQFKLKSPSFFALYDVFDGGFLAIPIIAPEIGALGGSSAGPPGGGPPKGGGPPGGGPPKGGGPPGGMMSSGPLSDWHNAVGTGPWIVKNYTSGVALTYAKNPNYWGHDERHPENQLPYFDEVKEIVIPDIPTALSALRTGKIDVLESMNVVSIAQAKSLAKANPEINQTLWPVPGFTLETRIDRAPFTDIRVRQALQLAINYEQIANIYYGGLAEEKPCGKIHPRFKDWTVPYNEWSEELKNEYSYNLQKAKKLLAEAAADGVFKPNKYGGFDTKILTSADQDKQFFEIIKSYFMDIGVDMEIEVLPDLTALMQIGIAKKYEQMVATGATGVSRIPTQCLFYYSNINPQNFSQSNDPQYEELISKVQAATTMEEAKKWCQKAELYSLKQHWAVNTIAGVSPIFWQPWIKGNSGEFFFASFQPFYYARWWLDEDMKKSMGK